MNKKDLERFLDKFPYPGLTRTLGELKLINEVNISANKAQIILNTVSQESFLLVEKALLDELSNFYSEIEISSKTSTPKENYGNTKKPNNRAPYCKNVIAVTSGKGGVGKSTVSANLAVTLAQKGYRVGLLDADVYGPNIPRILGTDLERMKWNDDNKIIAIENFGIKMMSVALTTPTMDTPLVWRSSVAISAIMQFLDDVAWGALDFMVIDMPPGTGDVQLSMAEELPISAAILVTTPQTVALDDVSRAIMMFKETDVTIGGIIENMSYFIAPDTKQRYDIFGKDGGKRVSEKYNIPFLGSIPLEIGIRENSDQGKISAALGTADQKFYFNNIINKLLNTISFDI
jgi:ATP-binding protein involved in chromosome partitioning